MAERRPTCSRRVFTGDRSDMGGHMCPNPRKDGDPDGLCGQHRAAQERAEAAPRVQGHRAAPRVETTHTVRVVLRWEEGEGPIFRRPYAAADSEWHWLAATLTLPLEDFQTASIGGAGRVLRKDGSAGQKRDELRYAKWADLPAELQEELRLAVQRAI